MHAGERGKGFGDFGGRDILALPAIGVADTVDEIIIAACVALEQIAGAEPGVARLEDVAHDLGARRVGVAIAVELGGGLARIVVDFAEQFADFVDRAFDAMAVRVALFHIGVDVIGDGADREALGRPARQAPDRAGVANRN